MEFTHLKKVDSSNISDNDITITIENELYIIPNESLDELLDYILDGKTYNNRAKHLKR